MCPWLGFAEAECTFEESDLLAQDQWIVGELEVLSGLPWVRPFFFPSTIRACVNYLTGNQLHHQAVGKIIPRSSIEFAGSKVMLDASRAG